ncbi:MAG: hypothetical protein A3B96_02155 [Candidatus Spechtbacteria bacterium RIFCSPHIGHO2_02_FULL_43_15b]|nr:MAG: hypothetical protein A3B96_02155 [Candidatus Spechtbacteria bacterium RIFCSPHIGHO2_02_FULL_43_15b]
MAFAKEMMATKDQLEKLGHICFIPETTNNYAEGRMEKVSGFESAERKIANNFIRKHYELITNSDAILVLNYNPCSKTFFDNQKEKNYDCKEGNFRQSGA